MRAAVLSILSLGMVACTGDTTSDSAGASVDGTTWHADVSPVLQTHCTRCHYADGIGTGDFTDYATASAMAEVMLEQIDAGLMPPPASDPECRDYRGSEGMHLSDGAREVLAAWVDNDTAEGDVADSVDVDALVEDLVDPDLEIRMDTPYVPTFSNPDQPGNEYRCFVLDDVPDDDFYVTGMAPIVGTRPLAHHIVLYTAQSSALTDAHRAPEGFDCIDGQEWNVVNSIVGAWAPGTLPIELPEGVGVRFNGGQELVMQMHYYDPGTLAKGTSDLSGYAFDITDSVETSAYFDFWGIQLFQIPAGEEAYQRLGKDDIDRDLTVYTMLPHMHVLGSEFQMSYTDPDGDESCMVDGSYDFSNQVMYEYKEPIQLERGGEVGFSCTWNNSTSNPDLIHDPPVTTGYGERTDEEMCFFFGLMSRD